MKWNKWTWFEEERKSQPEMWKILSIIDNRLYNDVMNGTISNIRAQRIHASAVMPALSVVLACKSVNGGRTMTSDEIEVYADLAMAMLWNLGDATVEKAPVCVADNIHALYGRCAIGPVSFAKLYSKFGPDCKVIDLICTPRRELQRILWKFSSELEQMIKSINLVVREDLKIPNLDETGMRNFIANITDDINQPHWEGPKARVVDIVIKYYLCDHPMEILTEMFKLSKRTIQRILQCWRYRVTFILDNPDMWYEYPSFGPFILGNRPYNIKYKEFSFLHRIRFLMMHRTEMSRSDNILLERVMGELKKYDVACVVSRRENNE